MSKSLKNGAVVAAFLAGVAGPALATCGSSSCGNTPTTGGNTNTTNVTVTPTQTTTVNTPVTVNGGSLTGGNNTATLTSNPTQTTTVNTAGTVGDINVQGGNQEQKQQQQQQQTSTSEASASVASGAVQNSNNYSTSTTYKAAASSAIAAGVTGQGHGCFQHDGGFGLGVQVLTAGVSGNYNQGEVYNKDCVADQAALAIVGKSGNPVNDALAAETAANMSENVKAAVEALPKSPLISLFAQYGAAAPAPQTPAINVVVAPQVTKHECPEGQHWNEQLQKCTGGLAPR